MGLVVTMWKNLKAYGMITWRFSIRVENLSLAKPDSSNLNFSFSEAHQNILF